MVSIHDVALKAGVSYTTVSKVLNNRKGDRTAASTRTRVMQAARELNYEPNNAARSLRSRRSNSIGFYTSNQVNDLSDPFIHALITGLHLGCSEHGNDLLIICGATSRTPDEVYASLVNGKVDGVVLPYGCDDIVVQRLKAAQVPAISLTDLDFELPSVFIDAPAGFRMLVGHLAERGHRFVLYRQNPKTSNSFVAGGRWEAFKSECDKLGIDAIISETDIDGGITAQEAGILLSAPAYRPTAVVCWNDLYAHRTMLFCRQHGLSVPDDIAVTGFDCFPTTVSLPYRLTTIAAPWQECSRVAVELIIRNLSGQPIPDETIMPVTLVEGDTT